MNAVVDIGSNSIKLLVAKMKRGAIEVVKTRSFVTRLGKGLLETHNISDESYKRSMGALREIKRQLNSLEESFKLRIVATAALREAENAESFKKDAQKILDGRIRILSGLDEAKYSLNGAASCFEKSELNELSFFDLGGASLEMGVLKPKFQAISLPTGAVKIFEHLGWKQKAISDSQWKSAESEIAQLLNTRSWTELGQQLKEKNKAVIIGGTMVLAAEIFGAKKIHSDLRYFSRQELYEATNQIRKKSVSQRISQHPRLKTRADIFPAGILLICILLEKLQLEELYITRRGLRHGIILSAS